MSVPSGIEPQGQPTGDTGQQNAGQPESHPPYWNELQELPEHLRPIVEPTFKKWEQQVNDRFQQTAQQYKQYEPYQEIINQYDPDSLNVAIQLATMMRDEPETLLQKLAEAQGYDIDDDDFSNLDPDDEGYDPTSEEIASMREALSQLSERIEGDQVSREQEQEEAEIFATLQDVDAEMQEEFGPMNMEVVLTRAATYPNQGLENALEWYYTEYARPVQQQQQNPSAPQPLGAGGGLPSQEVDMNKVYSDPKARQDLVAQMLEAQNKQ